MSLTERQINTLKVFEGGKLISAMALSKEMVIAKGIAENRIMELNDRGFIRKMNQTQYQISIKGTQFLLDLPTMEPKAPIAKPADEDDERPLTDKEMDRLLDGAVDEIIGEKEPEKTPMTLDQFASIPAESVRVDKAKPNYSAKTVLWPVTPPVSHPALQAIAQLETKLTTPKAVPVENLQVKKEVLLKLSELLEQSISDVLLDIIQDLEKTSD